MDLHEFEGQRMYFDDPVSEPVQQLLDQAAREYGEGEAEAPLLKARQMEPDNLSVLVALYRFYYYQHRLEEALGIAADVMAQVGPEIGFPADWQTLSFNHLANGVVESFTKVRFYLLALKGAAYLNLRQGRRDTAVAMLNKVVEFDSKDRLSARALLNVVGVAAAKESDASSQPLVS